MILWIWMQNMQRMKVQRVWHPSIGNQNSLQCTTPGIKWIKAQVLSSIRAPSVKLNLVMQATKKVALKIHRRGIFFIGIRDNIPSKPVELPDTETLGFSIETYMLARCVYDLSDCDITLSMPTFRLGQKKK